MSTAAKMNPTASETDAPAPLLSARDIRKNFIIKDDRSPAQTLKAVDGVSLNINSGEVVGVVGESGCGKSTLGKTLLRLHEPDGGSLLWKGKDMTGTEGAELKKMRRSMQMIFQDPFSSLNPERKSGISSVSPCAFTVSATKRKLPNAPKRSWPK